MNPKIDIAQLQADIANIEAFIDTIEKFIPGTLGDQIRNVTGFVEGLLANPIVLQWLLLVLSKLSPSMTSAEVVEVMKTVDVTNMTA